MTDSNATCPKCQAPMVYTNGATPGTGTPPMNPSGSGRNRTLVCEAVYRTGEHRRNPHFHAGHNDAGYLPESDVETFATFADAKSYMIDELLSAADSIASWGDEHDCDDVPCPTFGDECPEQLASSVALAAEELNLETGPEWFDSLSDGRSLPVSWWISICADDECAPESDDDECSCSCHSFQAAHGPATSGCSGCGCDPSPEPDCWSCSDCLMLVANGDTPPELDESETAAFVAEFERRTAGYYAVAGDGEQEFSWSGCDTCGSTLGGSRHAVNLLSNDEPSPRYSRRFDGLGVRFEVRWHGGSTFNIYCDDVETDVFTRYGDDGGNAPTLEQARQFIEDWAARTADVSS